MVGSITKRIDLGINASDRNDCWGFYFNNKEFDVYMEQNRIMKIANRMKELADEIPDNPKVKELMELSLEYCSVMTGYIDRSSKIVEGQYAQVDILVGLLNEYLGEKGLVEEFRTYLNEYIQQVGDLN